MTAAARKTSEAAFLLPMPCPGRGKRGTASAMALHKQAKFVWVQIQFKSDQTEISGVPAVQPFYLTRRLCGSEQRRSEAYNRGRYGRSRGLQVREVCRFPQNLHCAPDSILLIRMDSSG